MDNSFQTSFIPKKPITATSKRAVRPPTNPIAVLSILIFVVIGLASVGLFFYKNYLTGQESVLSNSLDIQKTKFEGDTINTLELYDKRVTVSKQILAGHIVLSPLFTLIGNLTIPSVQYTDFSMDTDPASGFTVKMSGVAQDYKSVALQADVFNTTQARYLKNVVFSNLTKDKNNNITFDAQFNVDPALLSYENNQAQNPSSGQTTPTSATNSQSATPQSASFAPVTTTPQGTSTTQPTTSASSTAQSGGPVQPQSTANNSSSNQSQ